MAPLTLSCGLSAGMTLWPEAAQSFQSQKTPCVSSYLRTGTKMLLMWFSVGQNVLNTTQEESAFKTIDVYMQP